jgi:LPS sulfotransferase NodH
MVPGRTPEEYLINMLKHTSSWNGVAGLKASWFQFELFIRALNSRNVLRAFQYIYLYRRDIYAQAVSLYKATESQVVHGNMEHSKDALDKLASLRYNYEHIYKWHQHIIKQEEGWAEFFMTNNVVPLCISYEEISKDIYNIVRRIALYLNIPEQLIEKYSLHSGHTKLANRQSTEWAYRYALEFDHVTRSRTSPRSFFAQQLVKMKRIFTLHNTFKKMIN